MLVAAVDLKHDGQGLVGVSWRDAQGRDLSLNLTHDLLHNLLTLVEQALSQSEWGLIAPQGTPSAPAAEATGTPRVLN
jgi:hypothetical protein